MNLGQEKRLMQKQCDMKQFVSLMLHKRKLPTRAIYKYKLLEICDFDIPLEWFCNNSK